MRKEAKPELTRRNLTNIKQSIGGVDGLNSSLSRISRNPSNVRNNDGYLDRPMSPQSDAISFSELVMEQYSNSGGKFNKQDDDFNDTREIEVRLNDFLDSDNSPF